MFGIPTRSDVNDEKYQRSVLAEDLRRKLDDFRWPTNTCFIHNHVIGSSRRGLDPKFVLDSYVEEIDYFRENLAKAVSEGFVQPSKSIISTSHPNQQHYIHGPTNTPEVRTRKRGIIEELVTITPVKKPFNQDKRDGFKIVFDPAQLADQELTQYQAELKQAFNSSRWKRRQLRNMRMVIERFDDSAQKTLLSHSLIDPFQPEWTCSMEDQKGTEAHRLKEEYKEIVKKSDGYLRFDEFYVVVKIEKGERMIPAEVLLDQRDPLTSRNLWHRQLIRDNVTRIVDSKGKFVFNGIEYTPQSTQEGILTAYTTPASVPVEFVNILGFPVTNGETISPQDWARQEIELVNRFRQGDLSVAYIFLEKYSNWGSGEHVSKREAKIEHLDHVLKRREESPLEFTSSLSS